MDIIQNNIRYTVYVKTNKKHIIDKQSDIELQIIMRSMYLQHSPNLEYNYKEQLEYLNKLVGSSFNHQGSSSVRVCFVNTAL